MIISINENLYEILNILVLTVFLLSTIKSIKDAFDNTKKEVEKDVYKLNEKQKELMQIDKSENSLEDEDSKSNNFEITIPQYIIKNIVQLMISFIMKLFYFFLIMSLITVVGLYIKSFLEPEKRSFYSDNIDMIVSIVTVFSIIFAYHEFVNRKKD